MSGGPSRKYPANCAAASDRQSCAGLVDGISANWGFHLEYHFWVVTFVTSQAYFSHDSSSIKVTINSTQAPVENNGPRNSEQG